MPEEEEASEIDTIEVIIQGQKSQGILVVDDDTKLIDLDALEGLLADAGYTVDWNEIDGILRIEKPV